MLRMLTFLALFLPLATAEAQKNCRKGIPCGNTCIAANKTCRISSNRPPAATVAPAPHRSSGGEEADSAAPTAAARSSATERAFVGSVRGSTYYRAGCAGARKLSAANLRYFKTEEDAQKAGYSRSRQRGC